MIKAILDPTQMLDHAQKEPVQSGQSDPTKWLKIRMKSSHPNFHAGSCPIRSSTDGINYARQFCSWATEANRTRPQKFRQPQTFKFDSSFFESWPKASPRLSANLP